MKLEKEMNFKDLIIYTDVDGTASVNIGHNSIVSGANIDALKEFMSAGGLFGVASGRNCASVKKIFSYLDINMPYVESNGACIYDDQNKKYIEINYLNNKTKEYVYDLVLHDPNLYMTGLDMNNTYRIRTNDKRDDFILDFRRDLMSYDDLLKKDILKCAVLAYKKDIDRVLPIIKKEEIRLEMKAERSADVYVEIFDNKAGKGVAIKKVIDYLNLNNKKLVCIGDNYNDIEMLKMADIALCPENAVPEVKEICEYITSDCKNNALKCAIDYLRSR